MIIRRELIDELLKDYDQPQDILLEVFAEKWDRLYPPISKSWRAHWSRVIPLFAFPEDIRRVIYTANAIESVTMTLRKVTRNHRIFPSDEAVFNGRLLHRRPVSVTVRWVGQGRLDLQ